MRMNTAGPFLSPTIMAPARLAAMACILATPTLAADLDVVEPMPVPDVSHHEIWSYVDLRAGWHWGNGEYEQTGPDYADIDDYDGYNLGGAFRTAVHTGSGFVAQFDAWASYFVTRSSITPTPGDPFERNSYNPYYGAAAHAMWQTQSGHQVGGFASLGDDARTGGYFATVGLQAVHNHGDWRFYGQAGYSTGLSGESAATNEDGWYAAGIIGYYATPNLYVSGNVGFQRSEWDRNGTAQEDIVRWGAAIEYKHDDKPVSGYLAYTGWSWDAGDNTSSWEGWEHNLFAGVRFHFRDGTLRDINNRVGLIDMNPFYGEFVLR